MTNVLTYRDLRRLCARPAGERCAPSEIERQAEAFVRTLDDTVHSFGARCWCCSIVHTSEGDVMARRRPEGGHRSGGCWHHLPAATVDRLGVGRWREPVVPVAPPKSRPKGTDEVAETGDEPDDGELHGGDGASGEVEREDARNEGSGGCAGETIGLAGAKPQGGGKPPKDVTDAQTPPRGGGQGERQADGTPQGEPPAGPPSAAGAARREVREDETGATPDDDTESDTPELAPGEAKPSGERRRGKAPRPDHDSGDASSPAAASTTRRSFGGVVVTPEEIEREMPVARQAAGQVVRAIRRLADDLGTLGDPTPKLDGARLVRELAGKSYRLARARRAAAEPAVVAILVDVSGSCAGVANALLASAVEAARLDDRVAVIVHSNGQMVDGYRPIGRPLAGLTWAHDDTVGELLAPLLSAGRIGRVIWAGDGDGMPDLVMLAKASARPLIWADSFGARSAPAAYEPPGAVAECATTFGTPRTLRVWRGVNTANRMADAIVRSLEA